jgi:hypothetical protein
MTLQTFKKVQAISCHCDSEAAISKSREAPAYPGQFVTADMDIILAIQRLVQDSETRISFNHVPGHPEKRKRKEDFTFIELANWECDRDAEEHITSPVPPYQYVPLKGAKCVVKIRGEWLSSRPEWAIQNAFAQRELEEYISKRLKISSEEVQCIDTVTIGTVRATQEWSKFARTSKLLFSWLPVGHNWHHYSDMDSNRCPCCGDPDETFLHALQCTDRRVVDLRAELFEDMWRAMQESNLPSIVTSTVLEILRSVCNVEQMPRPASAVVAEAWDIQQRIGFNNMAIGWIGNGWTQAFKTLGSKDPEGCTAQILTYIWEGLCEPIWHLRNDILHNKPNPRTLTEMTLLSDRLRWYRDNKRLVLAPRHHILAEYTIENIDKWNRLQRRQQLRVLDDAKRIYEIECKQRPSGQLVLTDIFPLRTQPTT